MQLATFSLQSSLSLNVIKGRDYTSDASMTWIKDAMVESTKKLAK